MFTGEKKNCTLPPIDFLFCSNFFFLFLEFVWTNFLFFMKKMNESAYSPSKKKITVPVTDTVKKVKPPLKTRKRSNIFISIWYRYGMI